MDLSIRIKIIYNVKHRYAIRLKSGVKFIAPLTKLVLEEKASICSTIKRKLQSVIRKFLALMFCVPETQKMRSQLALKRISAPHSHHPLTDN